MLRVYIKKTLLLTHYSDTAFIGHRELEISDFPTLKNIHLVSSQTYLVIHSFHPVSGQSTDETSCI